jgi:hypothetical protein
VPELEVTVRLLGPRLRGGGVFIDIVMPRGYPAAARPEICVQCAVGGRGGATWAELDALLEAAAVAVEESAGDGTGGWNGEDGEECVVLAVEAVRGRAKGLNAALGTSSVVPLSALARSFKPSISARGQQMLDITLERYAMVAAAGRKCVTFTPLADGFTAAHWSYDDTTRTVADGGRQAGAYTRSLQSST